MKSEKAKEAIERYRKTFSAPYEVDETTEYCRLFEEISEIAEQEAEERMRQKAIEAHRKVCFFRNLKDNTCANTATQCGEHSCYYMNYIIQELNEK